MNRMRSFLVPGVIALAMAATVWAQSPQSAAAKPAFYSQTNLVTSAKSLKAKVHDQNLLNPWGLVQGPTPFWISDNNAGVSTLYDGNGKIFTVAEGKKKVPFVVTIPPPASGTGAATPTGIVFNSVTADLVEIYLYLSPKMGPFPAGNRATGQGPYFM